jgi:hypothetical protein
MIQTPPIREKPADFFESFEKEKKKKLSACRGEGSVVRPLLAVHALLLRCAASAMPSSTLLTTWPGY